MRRLLFLIVAALWLAAPANAQQLMLNSVFAAWPHGSPVSGAYGAGKETAWHWISKWHLSPASREVASKLPDSGLRYTLTPDRNIDWAHTVDGGETFYLRQTIRPLGANLGKRFRASIIVRSRTPGVRGGFYVNARWNNLQRLYIVNSVGSIPLPQARRRYVLDFTMPAGTGISWTVTASAGIEFAFLFTTAVPATVDVISATMYLIP